MIVKLENLYVNLANFASYDLISGEIRDNVGCSLLLTETQNRLLSWFLTTIGGPQSGIFDVASLYEKRDEIEKRRQEAKRAETSTQEIEDKMNVVTEQYEKATGKKLSQESLAAARKKLIESGLHLMPLEQRKN